MSVNTKKIETKHKITKYTAHSEILFRLFRFKLYYQIQII